MGELLQYPLKQDTVTQVVSPDGDILFAYVVDYTYKDQTWSIYMWARDDEDAASRLFYMGCNAAVRCKLSDFVVPQSLQASEHTTQPLGGESLPQDNEA